MAQSYNTFSVLQPLTKQTYSGRLQNDKKKKKFKGPPTPPAAALPEMTSMKGNYGRK